MTISWVTPAAGSLGTITERVTLERVLVATSDRGEVTFSLIAGSLPRGLRLAGNVIKGSPTEVRKLTVNRFVIRASDGVDIDDRTFSFTVDGSDAPQWLTKEGYLPVGENSTFFVLDNSFVNFQLEAYDPDVIIGDTLEYYIPPNGGELPPGLTLTKTGQIIGFTDPIFAVEYDTGTGGYDSTAFDVIALDSGPSKTNGYDSFLYDNITFDYNEPSLPPKRLSRYYSFVVVVSDGVNEVRRSFRIYVVTEEFLRADNTIVQVDTGIFKADNSPERTPIWITESNLGRKRANNYLTIYLDVYNPPSLSGTITYFLPDEQWRMNKEYFVDDVVFVAGNPNTKYACIAEHVSGLTFDSTNWEVLTGLPPGTTLDSITGEVAGRVPYQPAVTKTYSFVVQAVNFSDELVRSSYNLLGTWSATTTYAVNDAVRFEGFIWICISAHRNQIPEDGSLYWTRGVSSANKKFTIEIVGEIESGIEWITDSNRGIIKPNQPSQIYVEAKSLLYGGRVSYSLVEGNLPPGMSLLSTGVIIGKAQQFYKNGQLGLTRFYEKYIEVENISGSFVEGDLISGSVSNTTVEITRVDLENNRLYYRKDNPSVPAVFNLNDVISNGTATAKYVGNEKDFTNRLDGGTTSIDRVYKFKVKASDGANFIESIREFYITVSADSEVSYSNLYLKAFQPKNKRLAWFDFITDANIFRASELYRYGDSEFSTQPELKVLLYAGIESVEASKFVQAISRNHYRKRLRFGSVRKIVAKNPTTQEIEYETVIVDVVDELEKNKKSIAEYVTLEDGVESRVLISTDRIRADSGNLRIGRDDWIYKADQRDDQRVYPNSLKNMRNRIKALGLRDRTFLPLWMRSIQDPDFVEVGYVGAVVLCYAKPGTADSIISRIKKSEFDFKLLDFEADRYLIDSIGGEIKDQYLAFPQRDIINKLPNPSPVFEDIVVTFGTLDSNGPSFDSNLLSFDGGSASDPPAPGFEIKPIYYLSKSKPFVNEGESVTITLLTSGVPNGTSVPFTITGNVTAEDLGLESLIGSFIVNNESASVTFNVSADLITEGQERITLTLTQLSPINSIDIFIDDTSLSPA